MGTCLEKLIYTLFFPLSSPGCCRIILVGSAVLCKSEVFHIKGHLCQWERLRWPLSEYSDLS